LALPRCLAGLRLSVRRRPPLLPVMDAECEEMCYFFAHMYRARFGEFPETGSGISRESCSNLEGWAD
jgi:hypothetical protein